MKMLNFTEQWTALQHVLVPGLQASDAWEKNASCFWENQEKILDNMESFANGWFERRHAGTHAALDAARRMCKAESPVDLIREYQDWAAGAFQRVLADGLACQQELMQIASAAAGPLALATVSEVEKPAEPPQAARKPIRAEAA